jgi:hypothetical protein
MDWIIIASGIVEILTWFVTKTGEGFVQKAGEEVYDFLRAKFNNDDEATTLLTHFSKKPDRYKDVLIDVIKEKALKDPEFGERLMVLYEKNQNLRTDKNRIVQNAVGDGIAQAAGTQASASVNLDKTEWTKDKKPKKKK